MTARPWRQLWSGDVFQSGCQIIKEATVAILWRASQATDSLCIGLVSAMNSFRLASMVTASKIATMHVAADWLISRS